MESSSRSLNGCWTCRLRRKKCDEGRPSCASCTSLDLRCSGFGPKPLWMDKGDAEREKTLEIKKLVSASVAAKRRARTSCRSTIAFQTRSSLPDHEQSGPLQAPSTICLDASGMTLTSSDIGTTVGNPSIPLEAQISTTEHDLCYDWGTSDFQHDSISAYVNSGVPATLDSLDPTSFLEQQSFSDQWLEEIASDTPSLIGPEISSLFASPQQDFAFAAASSFPFQHDQPKEEPERFVNAALLAHYTETIFYQQFPFLDVLRTETPIRHQNREWFLTLLTGDEAVFRATLALSRRYSQALRKDMHGLQDTIVDPNYMLAVMELEAIHLQINSSTLMQNLTISALMCCLQLITYEIRQPGNRGWLTHLRRASTYIVLIYEQYKPSPKASTQNRKHLETAGRTPIAAQSSTTWLLSTFVWYDVISCASTGLLPCLTSDYRSWFRGDTIDIEGISGCEDWVIEIISEVATLRRWKLQNQASHTLNISELVHKGDRLENKLKQGLFHLENQRWAGAGICSDTAELRPTASSAEKITRSFVQAALLFLYVVIHGAYPQIPEIQESVTRSMARLETLVDCDLLLCVPWPFCVTACLVPRHQREDIRFIYRRAEKYDKEVQSLQEALKIAEDCWALRDAGLVDVDWICVTDKQESYRLLI